ncbi:MAG: hypothetical protein U0R17_07315 [Acidimicrobiia bacterium]
MDKKRYSQTKDEGFILITALMVIFLVVTIVTTVALITANDFRASAKARAIITTRITAESVADRVYASIADEKRDPFTKAIAKFHDLSANPAPNINEYPLFPSSSSTNYGKWFRLESDGTISLCDTSTLQRETCFKARVLRDTSTAFKRQQITLEVVARGGCIVTSTGPTGCVYRKFTQIIRTRTYVDSVSVNDSEKADPSFPVPTDPLGVPYPVAYLSTDKITGKIFSNDANGFFRCGTVSDSGTIFNSNGAVVNQLPVASCNGSNLPNWAGSLPQQFIPQQINNLGSVQNNSVFTALSGGPGSTYYITGNARIKLTSSNIKINGSPKPYPSNGVIFIDGIATIEDSVYSRSISIVSIGGIVINGDIKMDKGGPIFDGTGPAPTDTDPVLGITTSGNIIIKCLPGDDESITDPAAMPDTQCAANRSIVGVLSAPSGSIYNNRWMKSKIIPPTEPTISIYGSILTKYRSVFGSYTSDSNAKVVNGWAKKLTFDSRLLDSQPPYFFRTTQASIVRSSIEVSSCSGAANPCAL